MCAEALNRTVSEPPGASIISCCGWRMNCRAVRAFTRRGNSEPPEMKSARLFLRSSILHIHALQHFHPGKAIRAYLAAVGCDRITPRNGHAGSGREGGLRPFAAAQDRECVAGRSRHSIRWRARASHCAAACPFGARSRKPRLWIEIMQLLKRPITPMPRMNFGSRYLDLGLLHVNYDVGCHEGRVLLDHPQGCAVKAGSS